MVSQNGPAAAYFLQHNNGHSRIRHRCELHAKFCDFFGRLVCCTRCMTHARNIFLSDWFCSYAVFETLQIQATSISFGVVNCTNEVLCPEEKSYPYDCCWKHATDSNTKFIFQNAGSVPQSSSMLHLSP